VSEREGKTREDGLANKLQEAQTYSIIREQEGQARSADELQRRLRDFEVDPQNQLRVLLAKFASDSVLQIEKFDKPVLLTFIDLKTKRPHFTVQLPGQQDFRLGIPNRSYQIQSASTDITPKINQVIGDDVQATFSQADFEVRGVYVSGEVI